jgi:hypothetical protein
VTLRDVFQALKPFVDAGTYEQLIVYFSGHGILSAPGAEFWLLSDAPENPNEAINLARSVEDARDCGVPHVVFISDACRSSVNGPPLSRVTGGIVFPARRAARFRAEVDVYYATLPGDPAFEVPEAEAATRYDGIFTSSLLEAVQTPSQALVDAVAEGRASLSVITSRKLKPYLEETVPVIAAGISIKMRQKPEIRVETALPKYFAIVDPERIALPRESAVPLAPPEMLPEVPPSRGPGMPPPPPAPAPAAPATPPPTIETTLSALRTIAAGGTASQSAEAVAVTRLAEATGLAGQLRSALSRGRQAFETRTGFTIIGATPVRVDAAQWKADPPFAEPDLPGALHIRLWPAAGVEPASATIVFEFDAPPGGPPGLGGGSGTALAVIPGFIGTIVVERGRVTSVNYVPSRHTIRYPDYEQYADEIEAAKAFSAVFARNGQFVVDDARAVDLASRLRQFKGLDPTLGLYAAYAYAQAGRYDEVLSVARYISDDASVPVPFDVAMLGTLGSPDADPDFFAPRRAPFAPMLAQGWALLQPGDRLFRPIHAALGPHRLPSLWTTFGAEGVRLAREAILSGEER